MVIINRDLGLKCLKRRLAQERSEANRQAFISHQLMTKSGTIQHQVYQTKLQDVNDLRQRLTDMWPGVERAVLTTPLTSHTDASMPTSKPEGT